MVSRSVGARYQNLRLYLFQCGTLTCRVGDLWNDCEDSTAIDIPVPWFLLTHPFGNIVIDGGNAPQCVLDALAYWGPVAKMFRPNMTDADTCLNSLDRVGVSRQSVRFVAHSHLHSDHTGALGQFPHAEHIVRRVEYECAVVEGRGTASGYLAKEIDRDDVRWRFLEDSNRCVDLLGDGVLVAIPTTGHTLGHQSFLVRLPRTGYVLLAHDAVYTMQHWAQEAPSQGPVSEADSRASIRKLKTIARQYDALVIPGHDALVWPSFKKAPAYYD